MDIELLTAVRPAYLDNSPTSPIWPTQVSVSATGWVKPGDHACVTLLTLNGDKDCVELPWGHIDPLTEELDFIVWPEGRNFARKCLVPAGEVRQGCDAGGATGSVVYKPRQGGAFAGVWVPAKPHLYQPVAFKLLTVPAGRDLAPYCSRQPILISPDTSANWLNPRMITRGLQHAPPVGTFAIMECDAVPVMSE